jgi:phage repressor protein C with HTH and peptisase S24 domain
MQVGLNGVMDTLATRLKFARQERGLTQVQLAKRSGVKQSDISKLERGDSLKTTGLVALARALAVRVDWLDTGDGDMESPPSGAPAQKAISRSGDLVIPQYAVGGAMGGGLVLEDKQPGVIKSWHVDREWLHLNVRHHTGINNLCIVTGFGPSMQPKYNPGDPLLLDRGVNTVETEGIFFFRVGKHGYIKQLQRIPTEDGMIVRAKSLNPTYDPFDITAKMDFEVFGKVLTVWRSEQV